MKNTRKNKLVALALAAVMAFTLCACSTSSSSSTTTTVSTSVTDENGNTTTNTTTTEVGKSVGPDGVNTTHETHTETTTTGPSDDASAATEMTPEEEAAELTDRMYNLYTGGAKGTDADGDVFYFAYNEDNDALMIAMMTVDHQEFKKWHGYADQLDDGQPVLTGYNGDDCIPYEIEQKDGENTFTMTFVNNGVVANMEVMNFDEFVEDLVNEWVNF